LPEGDAVPNPRYINAMIAVTMIAFGTLAFTFITAGSGFGSSPDAFGGRLSQRWQVLAEPSEVHD